MNNIIEAVREKILRFDNTYTYPNDPNFHKMNFKEIDWPSVQVSIFYDILRVLAIRGKMSLPALTNLFSDSEHPYDSVYQVFYRVLNGSPKNKTSLQEMELVKKNGRFFELTSLGVLYSIHVFHSEKYYDDNHDQFMKGDDFSYQKDVKGIFDILKKNYSDCFPLFFDNLDYIKEHKNIDINEFFDIIDYTSIISSTKFYNFYDFSATDFLDSIKKIVPFVFYYSTSMIYLMKHRKRLELIKPINMKVSKITYSIVDSMKKYSELYSGTASDLFGKRS